ncbi:fungal-specific transcription factor domain-containing protein [Microdochium trichocladiopsis]|uniref:Fungal-specific transcription factor domain-containing protein n=1 Tax=Microdochium trichocladiopsis TaxID=1682393 RepID=A0A9P9BPN3_9PEZI|nr:fungal-specific transcription factor domain-containing protein [Microdochium trichocladiopsis]KAH7029290.1 fungal-specific transcription factor domain-containing protein [Microdochium trichocladiopsis]
MVHSAASSCANSWSTSFSQSTSEAEDADNDVHWEQDSDDVLLAPKNEPSEDDVFRIDDLKEAPRTTPVPSSRSVQQTPTKAKRPRGRPRKHPIVPPISNTKVAKGRSKTGCITCRKRKKKCDEAKPRCMNCEKNAVVCEGYNEKTVWKSGKERADEERRRQSLPMITLQPIFQGVETPEDMVFLNHYIHQLSGVLTVESHHKNAFKDMLLQMAVEHTGLMHSILSLASRHIDTQQDQGSALLAANPKVSLESLQSRSLFHHNAAMDRFHDDIYREHNRMESGDKVNISFRYAQMLCLLLQTIIEGNATGEHRVHLLAYKRLIRDSPPDDPAFLVFITEFFQFHVFADELIRYSDINAPELASQDWEPWLPIKPARMIGVADGLFKHLCQITAIRNGIRANMIAEADPVVDYASLYQAAEIDTAIRDWTPDWPAGDSRNRVGLLYQQMMWVYLFRTIYPPSSASSSHSVMSSSVDSIVPARSRTPLPAQPPNTPPPSERPTSSRASSPPSSRDDSPAPIRYPPHHDSRITTAVDEALAIMVSLDSKDPCQRLLLIPALVIGTACFAPSQRDKVRVAVRRIRQYTGLRNCDRVLEVLQEVWRLMEYGDWARVWDWQGVARSMNLDFCCA